MQKQAAWHDQRDGTQMSDDLRIFLRQTPGVARSHVFAERPLVSVVLPVYNAEKYVEASIHSLLRQTYDNLEIIVVDDGSTDQSSKLIQDFAAASRQVRYLRKENSGIVDALNLGLSHATGEFIARQDADDISMPNRIERQLTYLYQHPECVAVSSGFFDIDADGELTGARHIPHDPEKADYTSYPASEPYLAHPFLMMRTETMRKFGYRHVHHAEDADLYWRAQKTGVLFNMPECLGFYRKHADSVSGRSVINGRLQAVFSQLCAISAVRVDLGREDLTFDAGWVKACKEFTCLQDMVAYFEPHLSRGEYDYLKMATIFKLLEFSNYRPYALEKQDMDFLLAHCDFRRISGRASRRKAGKVARKALMKYTKFGRLRYFYLRLKGKGVLKDK